MDGFGIANVWAASATLQGVQLTDITGFESLKLVEEAGNGLPTFELVFRSSDTGLLSYINEGNIITAGMGVTQLDLSGIPLRPMSKDISRANSSELRFIVNGFYNALDYTNNTNVSMSDKTSGLSLMQQIVGKHFTPDFSTTSSNDSMNWAQHGQTDRDMVQQLWTHSDLGSSNFPMIGITTDGTFRLRTANDLTSGNYQWNFTNAELQQGNVVNFHYDWNIKGDTGFTNYSAAYSRTADIMDIDNGPGKLFNTTINQILGQSASLEQSGSVGQVTAQNLLSNINHHENYHQSHADNVSNLANTSSTKLSLNTSDYFFPIKVLDVIMFTEFLEDGTSIQSFSGLWVVTEVIREISGGKFHTSIQAVRESMNNVQTSS